MYTTSMIIFVMGFTLPAIYAQWSMVEDFSRIRQLHGAEAHCKKIKQIDAKATRSVTRTLVFSRKIPSDYIGKCIALCMLEESKMVRYEEGQFVVGNLDEAKLFEDKELVERVQETVEKCLQQGITLEYDPGQCGEGAKIFLCLIEDYRRQTAQHRRWDLV